MRATGSVFAEEEATVLVEAAGGDAARLESLVARRVAGEPLEPLVGRVEFAGLTLALGPGVFVPRARTELVARLAAARAAALLASPASPEWVGPAGAGRPAPAGPTHSQGWSAQGGPAVVLDLCCGVGAVAAVVAARAPGTRLLGSDLDPVAVEWARANLPAETTVVAGDLFAALPQGIRGGIDVVAVNAPYVPTAEIANMPAEAREHEPHATLDGGPDGLDLHRRIAAAAPEWLRPHGAVVIEASRRQAPVSAAIFAAAGFRTAVVVDDDVDGTAVIAVRGARHSPE
ncbi:methyltransferase [Agromyces seonyuensis]|uniref:methyltransferase n=1 Tax=Agromyces seonyuensis TaxID=2662446 RepID=UPI001EFFAF42|nr:methyltransferase [Agromyces seonyuensis]